jgi:hypothetical protein
VNKTVPIQVKNISGVSAISAGGYHSVALKNDSTVYAWGSNYRGQLGDGTTANKISPVKTTGLSGITSISAGYYHNFALKNDGTLWAWGYNNYGQLGDDTTIDKTKAAQVAGISGITAISAGGSYHNLVVKNDGTSFAWAYNLYGQLGVPYLQNSLTPILCQALPNSTVTKNITNGNDFFIVCSLENITSFSGKTFKVIYDPTQVTLVDFAAQTPAPNVNAGAVADTQLEIVSHNASTGILTFKVNKTITSGKMWSGAATILKFTAKTTGSTSITYESN